MTDISTTSDDKFELDMEDALNVHLNGFAKGREYERRRVVDWLRQIMETPTFPQNLANEIEAKEHLK